MSGPPNDASQNKPFMGRVTRQSDGTIAVTPVSEVLGQQQRRAELLQAAQAFKDNPNELTEQALLKAALAI